MKYIALICARGGSKGIPDKNIRKLAGRPLIGWSIETAKAVPRISRIIVSTDSEKIARTAKEQGAEVPYIRPKRLAQDDSPEWLVWRHALDYLLELEPQLSGLVVIPPTAPLRSPEDIENCLDSFEKEDADVIITVSESCRSPYFNMIRHDEQGNAVLLIPTVDKLVFRRQDAPPSFDITTVAYVVKPRFVQQHNGIFEGKVKSVQVPRERAIDIDTLLDFQIAECLINCSKPKND